MEIKKRIAKNAKIKKSNLESKMIKISAGVKLEGVTIKAKKIFIGPNSKLTNCKLFSNGSIHIGKESQIKENSIINSFKGIKIGDRTIIDRDVIIGGMQSEKSEFEIGDDSVILFHSYVNITRKVTIGNNVGIGGYCLIFTHSSWQNVLLGNPYKFAEVFIHDNVWLPWHVTVLPGVIIGENATIGSSALINKDIPKNTIAVGIPAKVIKKKNVNFLNSKNYKIVLEILDDFHNYANEFLKLKNSICFGKKSVTIYFKKLRLNHTTDFIGLIKSDIVISFKIPSKIKNHYEWLDLESQTTNISSEIGKKFLEFIRRYGIRIS